MTDISSVRDLVSAWPGGRSQMRKDLDLNKNTFDAMIRRNSVNARHFKRLAERAQARGLCDVTVEFLAERAAADWGDGPSDTDLHHSIHPGAG